MTAPAPAPVSKRRDFPAWIYVTSFFVIAFIALLPLFVMIAAIVVAGATGCQVEASSMQPCIIGGADYGEDLRGAMYSVFFLLFTVPLGILLFVIWLVILLIHLTRDNNARKARLAATT